MCRNLKSAFNVTQVNKLHSHCILYIFKHFSIFSTKEVVTSVQRGTSQQTDDLPRAMLAGIDLEMLHF